MKSRSARLNLSVIKVDLASGDIGEKIREGFGMILVDFGGISLILDDSGGLEIEISLREIESRVGRLDMSECVMN